MDDHRRTIALAFVEALAASRAADVLALATPDATWWIPGETPVSGYYSLQELFALASRMFGGAATSSGFTVGAVIADRERAAVECRSTVRFADGRLYDNAAVLVMTFRGEKVAQVREYGDTELLTRLFPNG